MSFEIIFKRDIEKDMENWWEACNTSFMGIDWKKRVDKKVWDKIVGKPYNKSKIFLKKYLEDLYKKDKRLKMFKETLPKQSERQSLINNMYSLMSSVHCIPGVVDYGHKEPKYEKQWPTAWTVVFDITELTYYVKMTASPNRIWIDLNKFDFDTLQKVGILDVEDTGLMGEANDKIVWQ